MSPWMTYQSVLALNLNGIIATEIIRRQKDPRVPSQDEVQNFSNFTISRDKYDRSNCALKIKSDRDSDSS